jgi:hypothetical protein
VEVARPAVFRRLRARSRLREFRAETRCEDF